MKNKKNILIIYLVIGVLLFVGLCFFVFSVDKKKVKDYVDNNQEIFENKNSEVISNKIVSDTPYIKPNIFNASSAPHSSS